jgi:hypothetical protein
MNAEARILEIQFFSFPYFKSEELSPAEQQLVFCAPLRGAKNWTACRALQRAAGKLFPGTSKKLIHHETSVTGSHERPFTSPQQ